MHPIERLRYVARSGDAGSRFLAAEAAHALAGLADDPSALVLAGRRLLDFHPDCAPLWWVAARVLTSSEPVETAWRLAELLERDPTARRLVDALPEDGAVVVLAAGEDLIAAEGLADERRALRVVGDAAAVRRFVRAQRHATGDVTGFGLGRASEALSGATTVVLEALAAGDVEFVAAPGSAELASAANAAGCSVWITLGLGRRLPERLYRALRPRVERASEDPRGAAPCAFDTLSWTTAGIVVTPDAVGAWHDVAVTDCPVAPELLGGR